MFGVGLAGLLILFLLLSGAAFGIVVLFVLLKLSKQQSAEDVSPPRK